LSFIEKHLEQGNFRSVEAMKKSRTSIRKRKSIYKRSWSTLTPRQKLLRKKSLEVLSQTRKSKKSVSKIAKEQRISLRTVLHNTNAYKKKKRRWITKQFDTVPRVMKINEKGREVSIQINDSRTATLIGRYHNAVKKFLNTGDKKSLRRFRKKKIKDIDGNIHSFETNPASIIQINERIEEPEFYELYAT